MIAAKMLLSGAIEIPVGLSLAVIVGIVLLALAASWMFPRHAHTSEA
jgi:predicted tellurium resistance membrane protein TerC